MTGFAENIRRKEGHIVAKRKVKILGRIDDKDVELCRTNESQGGKYASRRWWMRGSRLPSIGFEFHFIKGNAITEQGRSV